MSACFYGSLWLGCSRCLNASHETEKEQVEDEEEGVTWQHNGVIILYKLIVIHILTVIEIVMTALNQVS